tara:strand:- start:57 stop:380 length:324 start_codon:yes stop_codon:yes gene_type:complete
MLTYLKRFVARVYAAYQVFVGNSIPVPIYNSDTCIFVIETEGSKVSYFKAINLVAEDNSYCVDISKIVLWAATKPRFFWKADQLGSQVVKEAEEEMQKHEKNSDNMV